MIAVYMYNGHCIRRDYVCSYVPDVDDYIVLNDVTYQVESKVLDLNRLEIIINLKARNK